MVPLDKELQWVNVKEKPFRQILTYSDLIKHIQELFRHTQNPTLAYLEPWCIQNFNIFKITNIFRTLV